MNWNAFIRQFHRWTSVVFFVTFAANVVALLMTGGQPPPAWITYSPLLPLFALMLTGLYLFLLPYLSKGRNSVRNIK